MLRTAPRRGPPAPRRPAPRGPHELQVVRQKFVGASLFLRTRDWVQAGAGAALRLARRRIEGAGGYKGENIGRLRMQQQESGHRDPASQATLAEIIQCECQLALYDDEARTLLCFDVHAGAADLERLHDVVAETIHAVS